MKLPFCLILLILCSQLVCAAGVQAFDYDKAFAEIEQLRKDELPKSVIEKLSHIYDAATTEDRADMQIRALIHWLGSTSMILEKDNFQLYVDELQARMEAAHVPAKAIMHCILASLYEGYRINNRWKFSDRSYIAVDASEDVTTWDLERLNQAAASEYELALEDGASLQKIDISPYKNLFKRNDAIGNSLYDYLAGLAMDYYKSPASATSLSVDPYKTHTAEHFLPAAEFIKLNLEEPKFFSLRYRAARLYQELLRSHLSDAGPITQVIYDLERLEYFWMQSPYPDTYIIYEKAMDDQLQQYQVLPLPKTGIPPSYNIRDFAYAALCCFKARLHNKLAERYNPMVSEEFRWHYVSSEEWLEKAYFSGWYDSLPNSLSHFPRPRPKINLNLERTIAPNIPNLYGVEATNVTSFLLSIYKLPEPGLSPGRTLSDLSYYPSKDVKPLQLNYIIPHPGDLRLHRFDMSFPALEPGVYWLRMDSSVSCLKFYPPTYGDCYFQVSDIVQLHDSDNPRLIHLVSKTTGKPLVGVKAELQGHLKDSPWRTIWEGYSDEHGLVEIKGEFPNVSSIIIVFTKVNDILHDNVVLYKEPDKPQESYASYKGLLYADRAIYRPGQRVFLKGIVYKIENGDYQVSKNLKNLIKVSAANGKQTLQQVVVTDDNGVYCWDFEIPANTVPGQLRIFGYYGSTNVQVEEYKRPRFEVSLEPPKDGYKLNAELKVRGAVLSYSGLGIDAAQVKYRIFRETRYPRWYSLWGSVPEKTRKEIDNGIVQSDAKGNFTIIFIAASDETALTQHHPYFEYSVYAEVTAAEGETEVEELRLKVSDRELVLDAEIAEYIDVKTKKLIIPIRAVNLGNEPLAVSGKISIQRLQSPDHIMRKRRWSLPTVNALSQDEFRRFFPNDAYGDEKNKDNWSVETTVFSKDINTKDTSAISIPNLSKFSPGCYRLVFSASYQGEITTITKHFELVDKISKQLAYPVAFMIAPLKIVADPLETAELVIGSAYRDLDVLYQIECNQKITHSEVIRLNNSQQLLQIPIGKEDRGNIYAFFCAYADGRFYFERITISVPWVDKELVLSFSGLPEFFSPGKSETCSIKVKDHWGNPVEGEVLVSMYDASLDQFYDSPWKIDIFPTRESKNQWICYEANSMGYYRSSFITVSNYFSQRVHPQLQWYNYTIDRIFNPERYLPRNYEGMDYLCSMDIGAGNFPEPLKTIEPRRDFRETAFFYPSLQTDAKGEASFAFTTPESLTRWKLRALAHTGQMQLGYTELEIPSRKPLMVSANAPRFVREGDSFVFSVRISTELSKKLAGKAQLLLLDEEADNPLDTLFALLKPIQSFEVRKGESAVLTWNLQIPFGVSLFKYRVVAQSGEYYDGEEATLPILSNRMLITQTLPLPMRAKSNTSFTMPELLESGASTSLQHSRLTLEYTANPVWYVVQSLPYLMEQTRESNNDLLSRYYANAVAAHILKTYPEIRDVLNQWLHPGRTNALLSNLEKNRDLKSLILEESPWLLDGKNDSLIKERTAKLLAGSNLGGEMEQLLDKIIKAQNVSGVWSWFPGMRDSRFISMHMVQSLGQLRKMGIIEIPERWPIHEALKKALKYLDGELYLTYNSLQENKELKEYKLDPSTLQYLYARSFFGEVPVSPEQQIAFDYFKDKAISGWTGISVYEQGLIALMLHRQGNSAIPGKIIASLRERALHSEEQGMWWSVTSDWGWENSALATQSLMIELFAEIARDTQAIDEMKLWLLKQKQTNSWGSGMATTNACYALLLGGTDWISAEQIVDIKMGAQNVVLPDKLEAGTGYFRESWQQDQILASMGKVQITNSGAAPSWGALYWQYYEDLDKIKPAQSPLSISKSIYQDTTGSVQSGLLPLSEQSTVQIGDRLVVRINIYTDRDLDFVHLKDMRGMGLEPINVISGSKYQDGLCYYEASDDAATNFYFDQLPKGSYVFEYPLRVNNSGEFSSGICTIQSMFAPEFASHTASFRIKAVNGK